MILQVLLNGLLLGGLYGVVALGFSLVYGVMGIINLAYGSLIMLGSYLTYVLLKRVGIDPFITVPIVMAAMFVIGYVLQRFLINRVARSGMLLTMVITFGLNISLINIALLIWSPDYVAASPKYSGTSFTLAGIVIPEVQLMVFTLALALGGFLYFLLNRTKTGLAIRAVALHREASQLIGVNLSHTYGLTFGIGAALAGGAGALVGTTHPIHPFMGEPFLLRSFVITVLGGLGSVPGVMIGGLVLGLAETLGASFVGPGYQEAIAFVLLVIVLIIRPQGLLGKKFYG